MTIFIIIAIVLIVFLYFNSLSNKQKALKEKEELEQKKLKAHIADLERKKQIEEAQKQKVLKEKQEIEQKRLAEQRAELERKKQIEEEQKQRVFKENLIRRELENKKIQQFQNRFIIYSNGYLSENISAFYHADYNSGGNWKMDGTIENMIWTLKNDSSPFPSRLPSARQRLENILSADLPRVLNSTNFQSLTVCVVPRAKKDSYYRNDQLYFRQIINDVVNRLNGFYNGIDYIKRHTNTKTTHLREGGDGSVPYIGITKNTCIISMEVQNKNILLIDDIYTKNVNIDEDAIQALLDNGANSVTFYSIGKTVSKFK